MNKLAVIVMLALAACSSKKPEERRYTGPPLPPVGSPVPGGASASGATGGAASGSAASAPRAEAPPPEPSSVGCATTVSLTCGDGQRDGCTNGLTAVHVCVAADAKAGPPCAQEIALACPDGQVDACLRSPPLANHHVCVVVPKPQP